MFDIEAVLTEAVAQGASDVHLMADLPPVYRKNTELVDMDLPPVTNEDMLKMIQKLIGADRAERLERERNIDFATSIPGGNRFRVNAHYQRDTVAAAFRVISSSIPALDSLNLPPIITELTKLPRGLILVTGPTGSGKSTTLASMINSINTSCRKHIITLEDPVEYALENDQSVIEQRQIEFDCPDFASGLKYALRQDPDIILVGEMRDLETTGSTVTAAETGHLVFSTLHTNSASQTIERIIDIYPAGQQNQIRSMLANTLQAVISQTLFKRVDQPGMVPCVEILLCNPAVRNCIRENRIYEIPNIIETSSRLGMQTMDNSIADMFQRGMIDEQDALLRCNNPAKIQKLMTAGVPA